MPAGCNSYDMITHNTGDGLLSTGNREAHPMCEKCPRYCGDQVDN